MSRCTLPSKKVQLYLLSIVTLWTQQRSSQTVSLPTRTVIAASTMLDGKGGVLHQSLSWPT